MEPSTLLKTVEDIGRKAGQILMDYYGKIRQIEHKGIGDVVTEADKASERFITNQLESYFPDHAVLGEEFGLSDVKSDYCWVTDPLDGTANYAMRLPIFSVAIALLHKGTPILGVVFDPNTDRMFSGVKGSSIGHLKARRGVSRDVTFEGATINGVPLQVNQREKLDADGLFGFSAEVLQARHPFMQKSAKGRALGSAALHICSVAMGYFDGSLDFSTKLWDVAAATVILEAAGGIITHPSGEPLFPLPSDSSAYQGGVVPFLATNGILHQECLGHLTEMNK